MAYEFKHNTSAVVMPEGHDRNSLKKFVRLHKSLKDDERNLLVWVLDQAQTYTLTVKQIRAEMQWGELRWSNARKSLVEKEVLKQTKTPLAQKTSSWALRFDFEKVVKLAQVEVPTSKTKVSSARVIPDQSRVSPDSSTRSGIAPEALIWSGVSTQRELEPTPKQQPKKFDDDQIAVNQKEQHFVFKALLKLGLKTGVTDGLFKILVVGGIEDFLAEYGSARQFAKNESGLAISIARRAASGYYAQTRIDNSGPTPIAICEIYKNHSGNLMSPNGLVAVASGFDGGQLRLDATADAKTKAAAKEEVAVGMLLSLSQSAKLWQRLEAAELAFVPIFLKTEKCGFVE
jgi:hypothetical protein